MFQKPSGGLFGGGTFGAKTADQQNIQQIQAQEQAQASLLSLYEDPYGFKDLKSVSSLTALDAEKQIILSKIVDQINFYKGEKQIRHNDEFYDENEITMAPISYKTEPISLKLNRRDEDFHGSFKKKDNIFNQNYTREDSNIESETRYRMLEYNRAKLSEDSSSSKFNYTSYKNQQDSLQSACKYIREKNKANQEQAQSFTIQRCRTEFFGNKEKLYAKESSSGSVFTSPKETDFKMYELTGPNIIKIKVCVFIDEDEEVLLLSIDKSRKVSDLKDLVINKLKSKYPFIADKSTLIQFIFRSVILNLDSILENFEVKSGSRFDMLVQEQVTTTRTSNFVYESHQEKRTLDTEASTTLAPIEKLPKMKKKNYTLSPSLIEMARMTESQLMKIDNLSIENEYGQILWEGQTDVRGLNFDELVNIDLYCATVYPEEVERQELKPEVGKGLNKPATIKLFKIFPKVSSSESAKKIFVDRLKEKTTKIQDAEFENYDMRNGVFTFKVKHFTTYDFTYIYQNLLNLRRQDSESTKLSDNMQLRNDIKNTRKYSVKEIKDRYFNSWKTSYNLLDVAVRNNQSFIPKFEGGSFEQFILSRSKGIIFEFKSSDFS